MTDTLADALASDATPPTIDPIAQAPSDAAKVRADQFLSDVSLEVETRVGSLLPRSEPWDYLYRLLLDYPNRGGKRLRPALLIASCEAVGGDRLRALDVATGLELLHNAFLIHDDIEDGSELRRGEPTMHLREGLELAINAGDALFALAIRAMTRPSPQPGATTALALADEVDLMCRISVEGQAMELGWRRDNVTDLEFRDYLDMAIKKTAWYTTVAPLRMGALLAGTRPENLDHLVPFGLLVGAAFQIQDDIINLTVSEEVVGKESCGDLWEGKRTPMLIHMFRHADPADRERLVEMYRLQRSERTSEQVTWLRTAMDRYGSIEYARAGAFGLAGAAFGAFERAYVDATECAGRDFLESFARRVLDREI